MWWMLEACVLSRMCSIAYTVPASPSTQSIAHIHPALFFARLQLFYKHRLLSCGKFPTQVCGGSAYESFRSPTTLQALQSRSPSDGRLRVHPQPVDLQTDVSEFIRSTNLFLFPSSTSSTRLKWGRRRTLTRRVMSPWRSSNTVPSSTHRLNSRPQVMDHVWVAR